MPNIENSEIITNGFAGKFLLSTKKINSGIFQKSIIYLFKHDEQGASGFIINHRLNSTSAMTIYEATKIYYNPQFIKNIPIHLGGPISTSTVYVVSQTDVGEVTISDDFITLEDLGVGKGPSRALFMFGYAGWAKNQLEEEIASDDWIVLNLPLDMIFNHKIENKWSEITKAMHLDNFNSFKEKVYS